MLAGTRFPANMPLADETGDVAGFTEIARKGLDVQRHVHRDFGMEQTLATRIPPPREERGEVKAGRVETCQEPGTGRRADGLGSIRRREPESLFSQAIEIRRIVVLASVAAEVVDAEVVADHENDVWLCHVVYPT